MKLFILMDKNVRPDDFNSR